MSIAKPLYFRSLSRTSILMAAGIFIGMTAPHNLSSQTTYAYVANSSDASISVIDTSTHAVVRTLKGGGLRPGLTADALNGKANLLLVTNRRFAFPLRASAVRPGLRPPPFRVLTTAWVDVSMTEIDASDEFATYA